MKVKLISYSQPPKDAETEIDNRGGTVQNLIAFCARVSNPSNQNNKETAEKLIRYLIKNKHWSPLEMATVCLEIETTRDIARQLLRHRSFSFQEFSQRYADPTTDLTFEIREARLQDPKNRQNSIPVDESTDEGRLLAKRWKWEQSRVLQTTRDAYKWAIAHGIAKEQARVVLPEGMTLSRLYVSGTIRSWVHFIEVRTRQGTQKEHVDMAFACAEAIAKIFPMIDEFTKQE